MYTGIVQVKTQVTQLLTKPGLLSIKIELPEFMLRGIQLGASVAINGVCLTVTKFNHNSCEFDVIAETLRLTNLGLLQQNSWVNVERSAKQGDEIGGHLISGHIDATAEITAIESPENNRIIRFKAPKNLMKYILQKGFIGLNGCSLTLTDVDKSAGTFSVNLIPETLRISTFGDKQVGDMINLEVDRQTQAIVDTVEAYLTERAGEAAS